ncbi:anaerobic ribonucleoside-triphosphate reductase activating protein [Oribacterium sp. oral taxon 108 str. F0425]|nr:anaerobic ribonucleoside-triphosphate reductase activating protein [Oribacterium sp. oral taxon 108]EGL37232.1 anaerobic ribonucleoside-triphosphate reductase activating protein [Oribacterium sp. oral taxon 108 str. F0425]
MHYAEIKYFDVANGPGIRVSLFVSGCPHACPGCFNEIAWNYAYGEKYTEEVEEKVLTALSKPEIQGLSLLGGEPLYPANLHALLPFLRKVKERLPKKDIWCYSGYTYEELLSRGGEEKKSSTSSFLTLPSLWMVVL